MEAGGRSYHLSIKENTPGREGTWCLLGRGGSDELGDPGKVRVFEAKDVGDVEGLPAENHAKHLFLGPVG